MSNGSSFYPQCGTAWLLAIGERLRVEYDQTAQPLPPRLIALLAQLGTPPQESVRQYGSRARPPHRPPLRVDGGDGVAVTDQLQSR
jgi:hypothetical protein